MSDKIELAYKEVVNETTRDVQGFYFYVGIFKDGALAKQIPVHTSSGTSNPLDFEFHKKEAEKVYNKIILYMQANMHVASNSKTTAGNKPKLLTS